ncbi:WG repeat-containing protein, partial [Marinigracilibium pacificum]
DASDENRFIAIKDKKYGLIDDKGEVLVPFEYESINILYPEFYSVEIKSKSFSILKVGDRLLNCGVSNLIIPLFTNDYTNSIYYYPYVAILSTSGTYDVFSLKENKYLIKGNRYIPMNQTANSNLDLIPFISDSINGYYNIVENKFLKLSRNYIYMEYPYRGNCVIAEKNNEDKILYGVLNLQGQEILPFKYKYISNYCNGYAKVANDNNNYTFLDQDGIFISPFKYDYVQYFSKLEVTIVGQANKRGLINSNGEIILPIEYDNLVSFNNGELYYTRVNDASYKVFNYKGELLTILTTTDPLFNLNVKLLFK